MALPFQNPVSQCMPGYGAPSFYGAATQTLTATGSATIVIANTSTTPSTGGTPFNLNGGPPPTSGKAHIRVVNGAGTAATFAVIIQVTDGTNVWQVASYPATAGATTTYVDFEADFKTDVQITAVNFVVTVGGTAATSFPIDAEVSLV
jgi:hypothetical protein